jgi:hypothetical protein
MALRKFASFEVSEILDVKGSLDKKRTASLDKVSDYRDYRTEDGYLYVRIRAISSRVNKNHDGWPSVELAGGPKVWQEIQARRQSSGGGPITVEASSKHKHGFSTFIGKPIFVDHHNSDPSRARGVIVDAKLNVQDAHTSSLDPYYSAEDCDPEHLPPTEVELLLEVDAKSFPKLAEAIVKGAENPDEGIDGFSMGCDVEKSKCSHCGKEATSPEEYCAHIVMKGADHDYTSKEGKRISKKSYENCYGIKFFEISAVFDPADETALTKEVKASLHRESEYLPPAGRIACPHCSGTGLNQGAVCPGCQGNGEIVAGQNVDGPHHMRPQDDPYLAPGQTPVGETMAFPDDPSFGTNQVHMPYTIPPRDLPDVAPWLDEYPRKLHGSVRTAENPLPQSDLTKAPSEVDTLRKEQICPVCGSDMDGEKCDVCGFIQPPDGLDNPDLQRARELDLSNQLEQQGDKVEIPSEDQSGIHGPEAPSETGESPAEGTYLTTRNRTGSSQVISDMRWTPKANPKVAAKINTAERPVKSSPTPATDEPNEVVTSDQTHPVTAAMQTAQQLIAAAQRNQENDMSDHRVAADPADSSGKAKERVNVKGIGGVDEDSNAEASRADKQVSPTGKGGIIEDTNAEASKPSEGSEELPTAGRNSDDAGFNKEKNQPQAPHTKTFDNSNEPGSAVTDKVFPASGEVKSHTVEAGDDRPFPHGDDALGGGGSAVKGVKPADPVGKADKRVDVTDHVTSPDNNSGPTKTWNGTGGNGVTRQKDPVTRGTLEGQPQQGGGVTSHIVAAMQLADAEVDLGLLSRDEKYARIAALEGEDEAVIRARLDTLSSVRTAGLVRQQRTAATEQGGIGRLPSFRRVASEAPAQPEPVDNELYDSALFG